MNPNPINTTEALLRMWQELPRSPDDDVNDATIKAIETDMDFDPDEPMGNGILPLHAALAHAMDDIPTGEPAHWPLAGEPAWNGEGAYSRGERVAAALLARGADPFKKGRELPRPYGYETGLSMAMRARAETVGLAILRHPGAKDIKEDELLLLIRQAMTSKQHRMLKALCERVRFAQDDTVVFGATTAEDLQALLDAGANPRLRMANNYTLSESWATSRLPLSERESLEAVLANFLGNDPAHTRTLLTGAAFNDRLRETRRLLEKSPDATDLWVYAAAGALMNAINPGQEKATMCVSSHLARRPAREMSDDEKAFWPEFARFLLVLSSAGKYGNLPETRASNRMKWRRFAEKLGVTADMMATPLPPPPSGWAHVLAQLDKAMQSTANTTSTYKTYTYQARLALWCFADTAGVRAGDFFDAIGQLYGKGVSTFLDLSGNTFSNLARSATGLRAAQKAHSTKARLHNCPPEQLLPSTTGGALALLWILPSLPEKTVLFLHEALSSGNLPDPDDLATDRQAYEEALALRGRDIDKRFVELLDAVIMKSKLQKPVAVVRKTGQMRL